jgi:REP element-mobilizing transposase RayT
VNNASLEKVILGYVAKYAARYDVKLYALAIEGNHIHGPALFPKCNRADFMRDLNSSVARAVPRNTSHPGGRFWARRYSNEFLPGDKDVEKYFFYTVLQAVQDGLVEKISDYPGYNCFNDAIWGRRHAFKVVRWGEYNAKKRWDPNTSIVEFTDIVHLQYERLPGYEHLSQKEYAHLMMKKLEEHAFR